MMDNHLESSIILKSRVLSPPKKENVPFTVISSSMNPCYRFVKPSNVQQSSIHIKPQSPSRVLQSQWLNATSPPTFTKVSSPRGMPTRATEKNLNESGLI